MDNAAMSLDEMCRRQWRLRTSAIREVLDQRKSVLADAAGAMSDRERLERDTANRILRAQGGNGTEKK